MSKATEDTKVTKNKVTTKYRLCRYWDPIPGYREKLYLGYNSFNHLDCVPEEENALLMDTEADAKSWQRFVRESEKWFIDEVEIEEEEDSNVLSVQEETEETKVEEVEENKESEQIKQGKGENTNG
jgi:hypothetical protein